MPRVPTYDSFQANSNVLPSVQVRAPEMPDVAGQQTKALAQGLGQAGDALGRITLDATQQANQVRVNDAMNKAMQAKLRRTYDPEAGFVNLKGDAALTRPSGKMLTDEMGEALQADLDDIAKSLGNDAQRLAFKQQADQILGQYRGSVQAHVAGELKDYNVSVQQGTRAVAVQQASLAYNKPDEVAQSLNAIKASVYEEGKLRGWAPADIQAKTIEAASVAHTAVVSAAMQGNQFTYATEYFNRYKDELTPDARLKITAALDKGNAEMEGGNAVRAITGTGNWKFAEADARLVEMFKDKPTVLEAARKELKYQEAVRKDAKVQGEVEMFKPVQDALGTAALNGSLIPKDKAKSILDPLRVANPELYAKGAQAIDQHNDEVRREQEHAADRARIASDRAAARGAQGNDLSVGTWYSLKLNPQALRTVDLQALRNKGLLGDKHFNDLVGDQVRLRSGKTDDNAILSDKTAVDLVLKGAKIETTGKDADPLLLGKFYESFNARMKALGPNATQQDKVDTARKLLQEVTVERPWWFDTTKKAFEVTPKDPVKVPEAERRQIVAALNKNGIKPSEENIRKLYLQGLNN